MKNRLLVITRGGIPYIKELRPIAGSVTACIVMQQLDYWFARYPDGFYKFMDRCEAKEYKEGDSWAEELGMTKDEFRSAFDRIGTRYTTKAAFMKSEDKFQGKFYCSFYDKKEGLTWYYRNHEAVDSVLDGLISTMPTLPSVEMDNPISEMDRSISTDGKSPPIEMDNPTSYKDTENTAKSTSKSTTSNAAAEFENPLSAERLETLTNSLIALRIEPTAAKKLAAQSPDRCERATAYWAARGFDGINKPAGAVRSSIEQPDKWPEIYAAPPDDTSSVKPAAPRLSAVQRREKYAAAYDAVWQSLSPGERDAVEREGKDRFEYIERIRGDELALAMRRQ